MTTQKKRELDEARESAELAHANRAYRRQALAMRERDWRVDDEEFAAYLDRRAVTQ
jgi:hypothetical protein